MKPLKLTGLLSILLCLFILTACPPPPPEPINQFFGRYSGNLTTTVKYLDPWGNAIDNITYSLGNVKITIAEPIKTKDQVENNPFSLIIESDPNNLGSVSMYSAYSGTYQNQNGIPTEILLESWDLNVNESIFTGRMKDNLTSYSLGVSQLLALKQIYPGSYIPWPYVMSLGSSLNASLEDNTLTIRLEGNVTSQDRPFVAEIVATRR